MKLLRGKKHRLVSSKQRPENLWNSLLRSLNPLHPAGSVTLHISQMLPSKLSGPLQEKSFGAPSELDALEELRKIERFAGSLYGKRMNVYMTGVER